VNSTDNIPGWEGSVGPFHGDYRRPHVYARDIHSGTGNCVCGSDLGSWVHVAAAPGVPVPESMRHGVATEEQRRLDEMSRS
jgi:predicted LPLAT superfamily acyltransferase